MIRRPLVGLGAGAIALAGCAVLTIDVDVYKGALANHESVQTEQIAAMAMGAKPILAELRYRVEYSECRTRWQQDGPPRPFSEEDVDAKRQCPALIPVRETADSVPQTQILNRNARRVNAILTLYEDAGMSAQKDDLLSSLDGLMRELIARLEAGRRIVAPYLAGGGEAERKTRSDRAKYLADLARQTPTSPKVTPPAGTPIPTPEQVKAVQEAWQAATDTWLEAIRLLSVPEYRPRLRKIHRDAAWAVAWVAADLTSPEGLRHFLTEAGVPSHLRSGQVGALSSLAPALALSAELPKVQADALWPVLAQSLADDTTGPGLAKQLGLAQAYAGTRTDRTWFVAIYPTQEALQASEQDLLVTRDDRATLQELFSRVMGSGLDHGRPDQGLETLITLYLKANAADPRSKETLEHRRRLLDTLVNFAEKVTIIANFDPLVSDAPPRFEGTELKTLFRSTDNDKYIRVLQAVGNSILSQVDALKQVAAHRAGLEAGRDSEVKGIRNAEARAAAALKQVAAEVQAKPTGFPGRDDILKAAQAGQQSADQLVTQLDQTLAPQRRSLEQARKAARDWDTTDTVVVKKAEMQAEVASFGKTATSITTADLASHLAGVLAGWEATARLPGGAGDDEAGKLKIARGLLADPAFTGDTANPGPVADKYKLIVNRIGEKRDTGRSAERNLADTVGDLERWRALAAQVSEAGAPRLGFPTKVEQGGGSTAKDVLDVMLTTLRYEHVDAVREDRNSERAKNRLAAVELLYAYRSGMIHIRPASTYLRNSYPATILQKDSSSGPWTNMLTRHALRQFPPYDWWTREKQRETSMINESIDKQFWQSVNQVRVAGAGRTNYAIAKDDVGNWYVKSYSADPTDIIQSAKNLALFSAGPALGANFLAGGGTRVPLAEAARGAAAGQPAPAQSGEGGLVGPPATGPVTGTSGTPVAAQAPRSALQRQLDRVSQRYRTQTADVRAKLQDDIKGLNAKLKSSLQGRGVDDAVLDTLFTDPATTDPKLMAALGKDTQDDGSPKPASVMNAEIAAGLRYVRRYRSEVQRRLDGIIAADNSPADPKKMFGKDAGDKAKTSLDTIFRNLLDPAIKERQDATGQYDTALMFLGETAGF